VKYVEVEVEVCSAPKSVFDTIEHFKYNNSNVNSDSIVDTSTNGTSTIDIDTDLTLYSRIHRLRVYVHTAPGLCATGVLPLLTSTLLPVPYNELGSVGSALDVLLKSSKVVVNGGSGSSGSGGASVQLLPHKMGSLLEVSVFAFYVWRHCDVLIRTQDGADQIQY